MRLKKMSIYLCFKFATAPTFICNFVYIEECFFERITIAKYMHMVLPRNTPKYIRHFKLVTSLVTFFNFCNLVTSLVTYF